MLLLFIMSVPTAARLTGLTLTDEQERILDTCPPPVGEWSGGAGETKKNKDGGSEGGQLFRVTAAAGAGKTTALLALALRAAEQGHRDIVYLTFTKSAARDGQRRLRTALDAAATRRGGIPTTDTVRVHASTLHSCAYRLLRGAASDDEHPVSPLWDERRVKTWIREQCKDPIERFLGTCYRCLQEKYGGTDRLEWAQSRARRQVEHYIYKTLTVMLCQRASPLEVFDRRCDEDCTGDRDYYPAVVFHKSDGKGPKWGFNPGFYYPRVKFYAEMAVMLFRKALEQDIFTFDFYLKRAQLQGKIIPGSIVLLDESQDMDGCQIDWAVRTQLRSGSHVYVVGDPAQAIYGFRGAKSQYLVDLEGAQDLFLLQSFRFGPQIANLANCLLFAKENSSLSGKVWDSKLRKEKDKNWTPYRLQSATPTQPGAVTILPLLCEWQSHPQLTVIARTNATLFSECIKAFLVEPESPADGDAAKVEVKALELAAVLPKVHIMGDGRDSGKNGFEATFREIEILRVLFLLPAGETRQLPVQLFPEFDGIPLTYEAFEEECVQKELGRFATVRGLLKKYGGDVKQYTDMFEEHVLRKLVPAAEANVILTTCHCAKGLEWDTVQVCDDFTTLHRFDEHGFYFGWENDEINAWYVACTRAKVRLSIPKTLHTLLRFFDRLFRTGGVAAGMGHPWKPNEPLSNEEARAVYTNLVVPLRLDFGLESTGKLMTFLVSEGYDPREDEEFWDDDESYDDGEGGDFQEHPPSNPSIRIVTPERAQKQSQLSMEASARPVKRKLDLQI